MDSTGYVGPWILLHPQIQASTVDSPQDSTVDSIVSSGYGGNALLHLAPAQYTF